MKPFQFIFVLVILLSNFKPLKAQEPVAPIPNDSITTYTDLPTLELRLAWNKIDDDWRLHYFHDCLAKDKLKMSCAHCASIYLTVDFKIDSVGKVIEYKVVKENMCGSDFTESLKKCFLEYFLTIEFPEGFRNMVFEINIGNGLKC